MGKTNVARALKFVREVCEDSFRDQADSFVNKYSDSREFKIEIGFFLEEEEKEDFNSFLRIYANSIFNKFSPSHERTRLCLIKKMIQYVLQNVFGKLSSSSIVVCYIGDMRPSVYIEFNVDEYKLRLDNKNCIYNIDIPASYPSRGLEGWIEEFLKEKNSESRKIEELFGFILESGSLSMGSIGIHEVNDEDRRKLSEVLYKYNYPSLTSSRIVNPYYFLLHIFASHIILLDEIRARSVREIEDEQFKTEIKASSPYYYGTGEKLALFLYKLKNSEKMAERKVYQEISTQFKKFTDLEFDISHTFTDEREQRGAQHRLDIWIMDDNTQMSINYAGSGLLEALNIFSVLVGNRNCIIVLDEPALHLHPIKQHHFMKLIKEAIHKSNNQFIIVTHSPYLIETDSLDDVIRFNLENNQTKIYSLANVLNQENKNKIKKEFSLNPHYRNMLFAKGIIIVEGESEEIGVPFLLQKRGISLEEYDIELFNAHGDTNFKIPSKIAENLNVPYVIVCDSKAYSNIRGDHGDRVFSLREDDFVKFLINELSEASKGIAELNSKSKKPQKTIEILRRVSDERIRSSERVREIAEFVREKFGISNTSGV